MIDRKKEIMDVLNDNTLEPTVDEFLFIEGQLEALKKLPFIKFDKNNPERQKTTPAARLYKELLQQYTNILKILLRLNGAEDNEQESPLRMWINANIPKENMDGR